MPGKRQHYVPRFLLRRFAIDPRGKISLIYRLDTKTGQPKRVSPVNEAVVGQYYRITLDDGTVDNTADELLDRLEPMAAEVVSSLADPAYEVTGDDVYRLMLFIVALKQRTPLAPEAIREFDEQTSEMFLEAAVSNRAHYHRVMTKPGQTEEQVEEERLKMLGDIRSGQVFVESTPDREVALMFMGLSGQVMDTHLTGLGGVCLRIPAGSKAAFVLSDHPVSHYDPTPKVPEAGAGFMSSPNSVTLVPLDPKFALLLVQDNPQTWLGIEVSEDDVGEMNLLTYAFARQAIYGSSQELVTRVRRLAKQKPALVGEFRYRPPRIWTTEMTEATATGGRHEFSSRFKGKTVKRSMYVMQEGIDRARQNAWSPTDDG